MGGCSSAVNHHGVGARVGPGDLKHHTGAVGGLGPLANDEPQTQLDAPQRHFGTHVDAPWSTDGTADVLVVHPAVKYPHLHERGVRHFTHRGPARGGPFLVAEFGQGGQSTVGHVHELGQHLGARGGPSGLHGNFHHGDERRRHMGNVVHVHIGDRLAQQDGLGAGHVAQAVLGRPSRKVGGGVPVGLGETGAQVGDRGPHRG